MCASRAKSRKLAFRVRTWSNRPAHGAHVHLGENAIDRLRAALDALTTLSNISVSAPEAVTRAIAEARQISEPLSGIGEAATLARVTVNIGHAIGGTSMNLVPASASAGLDIRLPIGIKTTDVETRIAALLANIDGVDYRVLRRTEPSYTPADSELVRTIASAANTVLGHAAAVNMRVGGSDSRVFRAAGIPTVVYGPTPHNMGGADEYALVDELLVVAKVHALTAATFLASPSALNRSGTNRRLS